jgi:hypothetical protein
MGYRTAVARIPTTGTVSYRFNDRLPDHDDVTSSWSGPPQSHIVVVACL